MKKTLSFFAAAAATIMAISCQPSDPSIVKTKDGLVQGHMEEGTLAFKGIPYAEIERFMAPKPVTPWDTVMVCENWGPQVMQNTGRELPPELMNEQGSCVLNVWTTDTKAKKPVMLWIHGGGFDSGSSNGNPGMGLAKKDVVLVSLNHRLNILGFLDLSQFGEKYKYSGNVGIMDIVAALKWINANIENFGGDPDNVTIFGESAGAGSVCALLAAEGTEGLFHHAIAQSGCPNFTYTHEDFARFNAAELLMKKAGATCMDDLMKLSEAELFDIYRDTSNGESLSDCSYAPLRGDDSIIPEDPYQAILDGAGKDVDLMIGTTADEYNYFIFDIMNPSPEEEGHVLSEETKNAFSNMMLDKSLERYFSKCTKDELENIREFMALYADKEEFWQKLALMTETAFRSPAIKVAENHIKAGGTGKTFMYYFTKENTRYDWIGASHGCELPYVFHNFEKEQELVSGPVIHELADQTCGAWASFAIAANPSYNGVEWPEYSLEKRETMVFHNDGTVSVENNPLSKQRELIVPLMYHYNGL